MASGTDNMVIIGGNDGYDEEVAVIVDDDGVVPTTFAYVHYWSDLFEFTGIVTVNGQAQHCYRFRG